MPRVFRSASIFPSHVTSRFETAPVEDATRAETLAAGGFYTWHLA